MLSFVEKVKLQTSKLVMTYRAKDQHGNDFFAYILCDKKGVEQMKQDYADQRAGAAKDYGDVIYADFTKDPDEKAKAFLKNWLEENGGEELK